MALKLTDTMPFGKHKGEQLEDLLYDDPDYLAWLYDNDVVEFDETLLMMMQDMKII